MKPNHQHLLVTLASRDYLENAKQLFSSVYHNAGWHGDYLLLAHNIPESDLDWFRDKGILIHHCPPLDIKVIHEGYPVTILAKFFLFTAYFRRWQKIIFLDTDIIVTASLDSLLKVTGLAAVRDVIDGILLQQINPEADPRLFLDLQRSYNLQEPAFNSGVLVFDTRIITDDLFPRLIKLHKKYGELNYFWEQGTLNLAFYNNWEELPIIYNFFPDACRHYGIRPERMKTIVLHFLGHNKPWNADNRFYRIWQDNLRLAEEIDLSDRRPAAKAWSDQRIIIYMFLIELKRRIQLDIWRQWAIDRLGWIASRPEWCIGQIGKLVKKISPNIYYKLIRLKSCRQIKTKYQ